MCRSALNATYYAQRASAGLIVSEATQVSPQGVGYPGTPGIHSDGAGRRLEARDRRGACAPAGGFFCSSGMSGAFRIRRCSPAARCRWRHRRSRRPGKAWTLDGMKPYVTPHALETAEIAGIVEDFRRGAHNARAAGFDGVELHGANGYLIDQFLRDGTNRRTDRYGGSAQNRARFLVEVTEAIVGVWGADRVGVRLSPTNPYNDIADSHPAATFATAVGALQSLRAWLICTSSSRRRAIRSPPAKCRTSDFFENSGAAR